MEKIKRYWWLVSTLALAAIYMLYQRRGRTITELKAEAEKQMLAQELVSIKQQSQLSQEDYEKAINRYVELKRRHGALLSKLGLSLSTTGAEGRRNH